jgi:hypothetical protein
LPHWKRRPGSSNLSFGGRPNRSLQPMMARIAAVLVGAIPALVLLSSIFSDTSSDAAFAREMLVRLGGVAALYALLDVVFGFAMPGLCWHWGLWLNVPALLPLAFFIFAYLSSLAAGDVDLGQARDGA